MMSLPILSCEIVFGGSHKNSGDVEVFIYPTVNRSVSVDVGLWQRRRNQVDMLWTGGITISCPCKSLHWGLLLKSVLCLDIILKENGKRVKVMPPRIQYVSLLQTLFKYWFGNLVEIR